MPPRELRREDFEANVYHYRAEILTVIDDDTVRLRLDLGDPTYRRHSVRLLGVNAPEVVGETRAAGEEARDWLWELVSGKKLRVRTIRDRRSFARYVADVYVEKHDGTLLSVADWMVQMGYAVPVEG